MYKNTVNQFLIVLAYDKTTGLPKTGDAENITAAFSKDGGNFAASDDLNPTELTLAAVGTGRYKFILTQEETNCGQFYAEINSTTENIVIDDVSIDMEILASTATQNADAVVTAIKVSTGWTAGGTWTYAQVIKVTLAMLGFKVIDKGGVPGTYQLLDAEDVTTVVAEFTISEASPQKNVVVL